jgi:hypothetical protein
MVGVLAGAGSVGPFGGRVRIHRRAVALLFAAACAAPPDGEATPPPAEAYDCSAVEDRCGGEIVGRWSLLAVCGSNATTELLWPEDPQCGQATQTTDTSVASMVMSFAGDGTYSMEYDALGLLSFFVDAQCVTSQSSGEADPKEFCRRMDEGLTEDFVDQGFLPTVSTVATDTECRAFVRLPIAGTDTGTWSTVGDFLTLASDTPGEPPETATYCASGGRFVSKMPSDPAYFILSR